MIKDDDDDDDEVMEEVNPKGSKSGATKLDLSHFVKTLKRGKKKAAAPTQSTTPSTAHPSRTQ